MNQFNLLQEKNETESEISLINIVEFVQDSWKHLVLAGIVGALLGFSSWYFLGSFKAQLVLLNNTNTNIYSDTNNTNTNTNTNINSDTNNTNTNTNTNTNINIKTNTYGLDILTWRTLQNSLPGLASQVAAQNNLATERKGIYSAMSDPLWWDSSVTPSYAISKADAKGLAMISKNLDSAATTILSFTINSDGLSKEKSLDNVRFASQFFKSGGAYLQLKALLNRYEGETISTVAEIQNRLTQAQVEQEYHRERIKTLEALIKRFPNPNTVNMQLKLFDPNENVSKYLPVESQLIAANNDLNQIKETMSRLNDRLIQIKVMKQFLDQAIPLTENQFDGILLTKTLLTVEEKLRKPLLADDLKGRLVLDQLRSELLKIEARYVKGLEAGTAPIAKKTGMLKTTAGSLVIAEVLMLMYLIGRRLIGRLKLTARA